MLSGEAGRPFLAGLPQSKHPYALHCPSPGPPSAGSPTRSARVSSCPSQFALLGVARCVHGGLSGPQKSGRGADVGILRLRRAMRRGCAQNDKTLGGCCIHDFRRIVMLSEGGPAGFGWPAAVEAPLCSPLSFARSPPTRSGRFSCPSIAIGNPRMCARRFGREMSGPGSE